MRVPRLPRLPKRDPRWWRLALLVNILAAPANYVLASIVTEEVLPSGASAWVAALMLAMFATSLFAWRRSIVAGALFQVLLLLPIVKSLAEQVPVRGYFADIARNMQHLASGAIDGRLILRLVGFCVIPLCLIPLCAIALLRTRTRP